MGADPKKEEKGSAWISDAVALRKKRRRRWGLLCVVAEGEVEPETGLPFFFVRGRANGYVASSNTTQNRGCPL
jgi:hypothetical protein